MSGPAHPAAAHHLDGRRVVVTGGGNGIGRATALELGRLGAHVVVNDLGAATDGTGAGRSSADAVVEEIRAAGGTAVAAYDDVSDWDGARATVDTAIDAFGALDAVVNNAGILRNRMLVNMTEEEWDRVVAVGLRGTAAIGRWAGAHWRARAKAGDPGQRAMVNVASHAGIFGSTGGSNYAAAKGGVLAFTHTAAKELAQYGVAVNAVAPVARSRLTLQAPGAQVAAPDDGSFDTFDPAHVATVIAYLGGGACPFSGAVLSVIGAQVAVYGGWEIAAEVDRREAWTVEALAAALPLAVAGRDLERVSINPDDPMYRRQTVAYARRRRVLEGAGEGEGEG